MVRPPFNVLFLCTGNSARSILGEALLNRLGAGRFVAYSAGSFPKGQVNSRALALLRDLDFPTEGLRSKSWDEYAKPDAPVMDFILTVCDEAANDIQPIWPGNPVTAHWGVPDPAAEDGNETLRNRAFLRAFHTLKHWITALLSLPLEQLDQEAQEGLLRMIGDPEHIDLDGPEGWLSARELFDRQ